MSDIFLVFWRFTNKVPIHAVIRITLKYLCLLSNKTELALKTLVMASKTDEFRLTQIREIKAFT